MLIQAPCSASRSPKALLIIILNPDINKTKHQLTQHTKITKSLKTEQKIGAYSF